MIIPEGARLQLNEHDEYTHAVEPVSNFNESMYFNAFDPKVGIGAWMRIGNRVNEGFAEMSCCIYLPDGRVAFMFGRPKISNNEQMNAGGMKFEVIEPFKRQRVTYDGEVLLLDNPHDMADPSSAFKKYPKKHASVSLDYTGVSPMHGGEFVNAKDGSRWELDPEKAVYRGHLEQHMAVQGEFVVDGKTYPIDGYGYRDKSWGPRHWHSFFWYRWLPLSFGVDFGVLLSIKGRRGDTPHISGNVLKDGKYFPVIDGRIETVWDKDYYQQQVKAWVKTEEGEYNIEGDITSLVPLRHKRAGSDVSDTYTRITEGVGEFRCNGYTALGISEFCDIMEQGKPISVKEIG